MLSSRFKVQGSTLRRGVTIIEVLFAIMVTAIGVMGALTLLPVAATQAKRARTADASATAVTAAVGYFDARGMRKPQNWIAYNMGTGLPRYPWAEFQAGTQSWFDGSQSYCIDPRMIAANLQNPANPLLGVRGAALAPGGLSGSTTFPRDIIHDNIANLPKMWRLSLYGGLNGPGPAFAPLPLSKLMADSVFVFDDDLNYDRAADASLVAGQIFDTLPASGDLARRRIDGHLSWMATLTPKLDRYVGLTSNIRPLINTYVLSVVVFHDRPADLVYNADPLNERVLTVAAMPGGGITGGEVLLQTINNPVDQEDADHQLDVHANEWIMLMGTLPSVQIGTDLSNNPVFTDPVHVFKWYRVSDIEAEATWPGTGNPAQRYVTLMGQDWPANTIINNTTFAAQAVVMEGVVAVMERTIRLEP